MMEQVFKNHRRCKQDGPLGPYIECYAAERSSEGYAQHTRELQIRLVAEFHRGPRSNRWRADGTSQTEAGDRHQRPAAHQHGPLRRCHRVDPAARLRLATLCSATRIATA